jgi:uncharacterized protein YjeT (DUF2065 family)
MAPLGARLPEISQVCLAAVVAAYCVGILAFLNGRLRYRRAVWHAMVVVAMAVGFGAAFASVALLVAAASLPQAARAQAGAAAAPDGQLRLTGGAVAAGIGYVWGSGRLDFGGAHTVKISGLSIIDVGAAKIDAHGSVYNLKKLSDFNGTYTSFAAGATIAGGGGVAYLRNQNGVVIRLGSATEGLRFNLSASGVTLRVKA